jgi:hypothetical protein
MKSPAAPAAAVAACVIAEPLVLAVVTVRSPVFVADSVITLEAIVPTPVTVNEVAAFVPFTVNVLPPSVAALIVVADAEFTVWLLAVLVTARVPVAVEVMAPVVPPATT